MIRSLVLSCVLAGVPAVMPAQTAEEHVRAGAAEMDALRPDSALPHLEAALAADSLHAEAAWRAAVAVSDIAKQIPDDERSDLRDSLYVAAERYARQAVAADSTSADAWFALANTLGRTALAKPPRERVQQAALIREAALRAIELDARHDGAYHVLGRWHAEIMRLSGVTRFFARRFMGATVFDEASWDAAIENLERAVALNPTYVYHRLDLAEVLVDRKRWEEARRQLEAIPSLPPRDVLDEQHKSRAAALLAEIADRG